MVAGRREGSRVRHPVWDGRLPAPQRTGRLTLPWQLRFDADHEDPQTRPDRWYGPPAFSGPPPDVAPLDRPPPLALSSVPHHPDTAIRVALELGLQGLVGAGVAAADDDEMRHWGPW